MSRAQSAPEGSAHKRMALVHERLCQHRACKGLYESMYVCPLSNRTEVDIWRCILKEGIAVVPRCFAALRPVAHRPDALITVTGGYLI